MSETHLFASSFLEFYAVPNCEKFFTSPIHLDKTGLYCYNLAIAGAGRFRPRWQENAMMTQHFIKMRPS